MGCLCRHVLWPWVSGWLMAAEAAAGLGMSGILPEQLWLAGARRACSTHSHSWEEILASLL